MNYFDEDTHAKDYIHMSRKYDGSALIPHLRKHLPDASTVLELGMGPGKDLDLLSKHYSATGSDSSVAFLDIYRETHHSANLLLLDAATLDTERTFDGIFSNKVLIHLTQEEIRSSFQRQAKILKPGGIAFHSFWRGDKEEVFDGLRFTYMEPETLLPLIDSQFEVLETQIYKESKKEDSFLIILRLRS